MEGKQYQVVDVEQGTAEWLKLRYDYVTASQVSILFDLSPYETRLSLFEQKVLRVEPLLDEKKQLLFAKAHRAEEAGREWVKNKLNLRFVPTVVVSRRVSHLLASLDGFIPEKGLIFEAKYMGQKNFDEVKSGKIPKHHECQIQAQLLATNAEKCIYFAMTDDDASIIELRPDSEYFRQIEKAVPDFMKLVKEGIPPEPSHRDFITLQDERFKKLYDLKIQIDGIQQEYESLKETLIKEYNYPRIRAGGLLLTKVISRGSIDYSKIEELKGVDLEKYRKQARTSVRVSLDKGVA